ncbi:MAG TPA: hypothetical protein VIJ25_06850, partial [Methylococcales bacterium]
MKMKFFMMAWFLINGMVTNAQPVKNTSYISRNGEKVLQLEAVLPVNFTDAWQLFTTDAQLMKWIAPVAHIELKTGGYILTNYDKTKSLSDSSSIKLGIINFLENELLTLKVNLNNSFSPKAKAEDGNLQEIIQFVYISPKETKVVSSMVGWGKGEEWDKTYGFFERGNIWTYEEMLKLF